MNEERQAGYTETSIGWAPDDWRRTTLDELCDGKLQTGPFGSQLHAEEYVAEGVSVLMPKDLVNYQARLKGAAKISPARAQELSRHRLSAGDFLFSRRGDVARFALIDEYSEGALCGTGCLRARPSKNCSAQYLSQLLRFKPVSEWLEQNAVGQTMPNMNTGILKSLPLVLPPTLREQQQIAAILAAVDDKLNLTAAQVSGTQNLKQGLMQSLFSRGVGAQDAKGCWTPHREFGPHSFRQAPVSWKVRKLGDIAPLVRRPVEIRPDALYPELGLRSYGKGTFHKPALLGAEVGSKRLFQIKAGDLLLSNVFAWEGAVAVAKPEDDGRFGSHRYITCQIDQTQADTSYVFRFLTTPAGLSLLAHASPGGAGRNKTLGLLAMAKIAIPLPPLPEQQQISQILDSVDAKLRLLESKQMLYKSLKRGLMQRLLTGELRVRLGSSAATG